MSEMNFDPQTGEPVYTVQSQTETSGYEQPVSPQNKKTLIIVLCVIVLLILSSLTVFLVKEDMFPFLSSPNEKIISGFDKVLEENELMKALDLSSIYSDGNYSVGYDISSVIDDEQSNISVELQMDAKGKKSDGKFLFNSRGMELGMNMYMDDSLVYIDIPMLCEGGMVYYYDGPKDGFLLNMLYQGTEINEDSMTALGEFLSGSFDQVKESQKYADQYKDLAEKRFRKLKAEKVSDKEWTVDGMQKKCKGYKVTVSKEEMKAFLDDVKSTYIQQMKDLKYFEILDKMDISDNLEEDISGSFESLKESMDSVGNSDLTFYLHGGKTVAVVMTEEQKDGENTLEFPDKNKIHLSMSGEADFDMNLNYDKETGDLDISTDTVEGQKNYKLNVTNNREEFSLKMEETQLDEYVKLGGNIVMKKGTNIEKPDLEKALDIGKSTEKDISRFSLDWLF